MDINWRPAPPPASEQEDAANCNERAIVMITLKKKNLIEIEITSELARDYNLPIEWVGTSQRVVRRDMLPIVKGFLRRKVAGFVGYYELLSPDGDYTYAVPFNTCE